MNVIRRQGVTRKDVLWMHVQAFLRTHYRAELAECAGLHMAAVDLFADKAADMTPDVLNRLAWATGFPTRSKR